MVILCEYCFLKQLNFLSAAAAYIIIISLLSPTVKPSNEGRMGRETIKPSNKNNNLSNVQLNLDLSKVSENSSEKSPVSKTEPSVEAKMDIVSNFAPGMNSVRKEQTSVSENKVPDAKKETLNNSNPLTTSLANKFLMESLPGTTETNGVSQLIPGGVINIGSTGPPPHTPVGATGVTDLSKEDEEDQLQHLENAAESLLAELDVSLIFLSANFVTKADRCNENDLKISVQLASQISLNVSFVMTQM